MSDRRRVEQILMNLVGNTIKFTERGRVEVACKVVGTEVEVQVLDTGIGIRSEDIGALFPPFRQVDSGTTRNYEGTGLGGKCLGRRQHVQLCSAIEQEDSVKGSSLHSGQNRGVVPLICIDSGHPVVQGEPA